MPSDKTLPQRRYLRHKKGDHSLCRPEYCVALRNERVPVVVPETEPGETVGSRYGIDVPGLRLWKKVTAEGPVGPYAAILLVEACRITDRLDKLNKQLAGEDWLRFHHDESGVEIRMYCDRVLAEAREQSNTLARLMTDIHKLTTTAKAVSQQQPQVGEGVVDLRKRIADRRPASPA